MKIVNAEILTLIGGLVKFRTVFDDDSEIELVVYSDNTYEFRKTGKIDHEKFTRFMIFTYCTGNDPETVINGIERGVDEWA